MRASASNSLTSSMLSASSLRIFLMHSFLEKPEEPLLSTIYKSAMPPRARTPATLYLPICSTIFNNYPSAAIVELDKHTLS